MEKLIERPILMNAEMVRATLADRKTQTRRIIERKDAEFPLDYLDGMFRFTNGDVVALECPYGEPGDRLWVRETWQTWGEFDRLHANDIRVEARRSLNYPADGSTWTARRRPSIDMPRWASRILLEITDVRVQRLQHINSEDAEAEGNFSFSDEHGWHSAEEGFCHSWEAINGDGSWYENPLVWAITFKRITAAQQLSWSRGLRA